MGKIDNYAIDDDGRQNGCEREIHWLLFPYHDSVEDKSTLHPHPVDRRPLQVQNNQWPSASTPSYPFDIFPAPTFATSRLFAAHKQPAHHHPSDHTRRNRISRANAILLIDNPVDTTPKELSKACYRYTIDTGLTFQLQRVPFITLTIAMNIPTHRSIHQHTRGHVCTLHP